MQYLFAQGVNSSGSYLIPKPQKESYTGKVLRLPSSVAISTDLDNDARTILGKVFQEVLNVRTSFAPDEKSFVRFHVDQELAAEAYIIKTDRKRIEIYASSPQGSLWAVQTLHQMLKHAGRSGTGNPKYLPAGEIEDFPVHQWRSFHLDVARHFFTKEFLFRTIERLSFYKINKLHLHLSDDQGWRIEIDKYPLLTGIGGWRTFDRFDSICIRKARLDPDMEIDKRFIRQDSMYGGFYTKADMKAIIGHAKKYRIEIIPEIDMPGHMSAAIRAYPWLSCTGNPGWGKEFSHPVCVCDPRVIDFAKDVYEEITALFPSEYIHIGADEVEKDSWEADHDCQELIKEKGLESPEGLQTLFVNEMHQFLKEKGKKTIVWDDAAMGDMDEDIYVYFWRDWVNENPRIITGKGYPVVFMPWSHFYLSSEPGHQRLKELYEFDITADYPAMADSKVLGYQACVWTEEIPNEVQFEKHVFPALQAFSERVWSTERDWDDFERRVRAMGE